MPVKVKQINEYLFSDTIEEEWISNQLPTSGGCRNFGVHERGGRNLLVLELVTYPHIRRSAPNFIGVS